MKPAQIERKIKALEVEKHKAAIKENVTKHPYNTLFFTYGSNYRNKVHFAYLACKGMYDSYALLCEEDDWRGDGRDDEGHMLDMIELIENEAIFMDWKEAVQCLCPECISYLSLNQVITNYISELKSQWAREEKLAKKRQTQRDKQIRCLIHIAQVEV